jgi:hypothetical protein
MGSGERNRRLRAMSGEESVMDKMSRIETAVGTGEFCEVNKR